MDSFLVTSFPLLTCSLGGCFVMMMITVTVETGPCLVTQAGLKLAVLPELPEL